MMDRLGLPIGDASFRNLRTSGCYYVDKTLHIGHLIQEGRYWFLSRPRRFGKTLLVDTMQELFEGSEALFRELHIHDHWDWDHPHPVIRLSFSANYDQPKNLHSHIQTQLAAHEEEAGIQSSPEVRTGPERLQHLVRGLHRATGQQVVVLVDEYDKPILDVLENPELAKANRDTLRGFYGILKDCARYLRFVFVTGISMYSKVSLFSGLNNLNDISLVPRYATICGYTEADLDTVFAPEVAELAEGEREKIRDWYNGYHWLGQEKVYNPFDILLYFQNRKFIPYWYRTGTPSVLVHRLKNGAINTLDLDNLGLYDRELSNFDLEKISVHALLFQCGYLTIVQEEVRGSRVFYTLDYPNFEVRLSLNEELLEAVAGDLTKASEQGETLVDRLEANDFEGFARELRAFWAGIPYPWPGHGNLAHFEGFYASVLYACFFTLGLDVRVEEVSSQGRSDMVLIREGQVFVLELKVAEAKEVEAKAGQALDQMRERGYADKYRRDGPRIHLLAVVFDRKERNLATIRAEET